MVDRGWSEVFSESDGKTNAAAYFLRTEVSQSQNTGLFRVTLADYNNEKLGLQELLKDRDSVKALLDHIALVDPYKYRHDPKYQAEVLNAKGVGSAEGFAAVMEGIVSSSSKSALWVMGAVNCPSCAATDLEAAFDSVMNWPEEVRLKGYLDVLHTMQGNGIDVVKANAAVATATGVGLGLLLDGGLVGGVKGTGKDYIDILSPEDRLHILYGNGPGSGGHLWPGQEGKTVFPKTWSADKIIDAIGDIATSPDTKWFAQTGTGGIYTAKGDPAKWVSYEVRDGVRIRVVYQPATGRVITGFPDDQLMPPYKPIK